MHILLVVSGSYRARRLKKLFAACKYAVDELHSASCGLTRLEQRAVDYDVVLFDTTDTDIEPEEWCAAVRKHSNIPIIAVTTATSDDLIVKLLLEYVDDFVRLPVEPVEMFARIQAVLRRPRRVSTPCIKIGRLELERSSGNIQCDGEPVRLSKKEANLLFYLAEQQDRVVTREAMIGHVWDTPDATASNTLDAHIRNLRTKLPGQAACAIETVRGVGYRLTAKQRFM